MREKAPSGVEPLEHSAGACKRKHSSMGLVVSVALGVIGLVLLFVLVRVMRLEADAKRRQQ